MKTSLTSIPYSAHVWQQKLRFKAVSARWVCGMSEDIAFLSLLGRPQRSNSLTSAPESLRWSHVPFPLCTSLIDCAMVCVPVMILSLLAQSLDSEAQFYTLNNHGIMSLLFSCLTEAGYLIIHSHRKNTRRSRLKPFDFLPKCLRSEQDLLRSVHLCLRTKVGLHYYIYLL